MHGQGKMTYKTGETYLGEYKSNMQHGYGVYTFSDGMSYEGEWFKGKQHGTGILRDMDGQIVKTTWKNGELVDAIDITDGYDENAEASEGGNYAGDPFIGVGGVEENLEADNEFEVESYKQGEDSTHYDPENVEEKIFDEENEGEEHNGERFVWSDDEDQEK